MNCLILGGNSQRHKVWVRELAGVLERDFSRVAFLDYKHWESGGNADVDYEISQSSELAGTLGDYIIIAKSIGTIITTLGVAAGRLQPKRCLFLGLPLDLANDQNVAVAFAKLPPLVLLQNERDPLCSFKQAQDYLARHGNKHASVVMAAGDTHDYSDFTLIERLAVG